MRSYDVLLYACKYARYADATEPMFRSKVGFLIFYEYLWIFYTFVIWLSKHKYLNGKIIENMIGFVVLLSIIKITLWVCYGES